MSPINLKDATTRLNAKASGSQPSLNEQLDTSQTGLLTTQTKSGKATNAESSNATGG